MHGDDIIGKGIETYRNYLYHLYENKPRRTVYEDFAYGYDDYLQIPLQPLKDNLDSNTYEVGLKVIHLELSSTFPILHCV